MATIADLKATEAEELATRPLDKAGEAQLASLRALIAERAKAANAAELRAAADVAIAAAKSEAADLTKLEPVKE